MSEERPDPFAPVPMEFRQELYAYLKKNWQPWWGREAIARYRREGMRGVSFGPNFDLAAYFYERFPEMKPKEPPATDAAEPGSDEQENSGET